jgi:manganese/zinc/iron transport system substrate-binding protein
MAKATQYPYKVVVTTAMVGDIVRQVAGDKANVMNLMGETVDPHLYKPTRDDMVALRGADAVFYSGLGLEGRMTDAFTRINRSGKPVFAVTEKIDPSYLREPPEFQGHFDPHVWMDPAAWSKCVEMVAEALGEFDPPNKSQYEQRSAAYRKELEALDSYCRKVIASIPKDRRVLVTAHDAFGYFSRAYDIPVYSVQGISTESEASVQDVNKVIETIIKLKVPAIFVEPSVGEKNMQAVIEGAARQKHTVRIGGSLFSDSMGASGTYEGTYIGMLDQNATTIARALGGEAPEKGLNGQLTVKAKSK